MTHLFTLSLSWGLECSKPNWWNFFGTCTGFYPSNLACDVTVSSAHWQWRHRFVTTLILSECYRQRAFHLLELFTCSWPNILRFMFHFVTMAAALYCNTTGHIWYTHSPHDNRHLVTVKLMPFDAHCVSLKCPWHLTFGIVTNAKTSGIPPSWVISRTQWVDPYTILLLDFAMFVSSRLSCQHVFLIACHAEGSSE